MSTLQTPTSPNPAAPVAGEAAVGKSAPKCPFARMFGGKQESLAEALRDRTKEAHTRAEKHPAQARLVKGEATRADYARWLGQMYHVWSAIDACVAGLAGKDARIAAIVRPYHAHAHRVESDLRHLGHEPSEFPPVPAAREFARRLSVAAERAEVSAVGAWYVLEGSANGGRFIARALSRALALPGPEGLSTLDPHGTELQPRWSTWKSDLDAQRWTREERDAMVAEASRTFDTIHDIMDQTPAQ